MGYPENIVDSYGPTLDEGAKADSIESFIMLTGKKLKSRF